MSRFRARSLIQLVAAAVGLAALTACAQPESAPISQPTPRIVYVTATPGPTPTPAPSPSPAPGFVAAPTPDGPYFSRDIQFAIHPDPALASRSFPRKTPQVYALWQYSGMTANLRIRREWYQNGVLYLDRESDWDLSRYGASGTMMDTSVFDFASGLPSGRYELRLTINGQPQFSAEDAPFRSFDVGVEAVSTTLSPDGKFNARVDRDTTLLVMDGAGRRREIARAEGVAGFDWLPDSVHLAYALRQAVGYELWIANVETGEVVRLSRENENLRFPKVSPDGRTIAVVTGTSVSDACAIDVGLGFIQLDSTLARARLLTLAYFRGLPYSGETGGSRDLPYAVDESGQPINDSPGVWQSPARFKAYLRWACVDNLPDGVYALDLAALSAQKVGNLPPR